MRQYIPRNLRKFIRTLHWHMFWRGIGPVHQGLKIKILEEFFIPNAAVIETGTYFGDTSLSLANMGHEVHTIEIQGKIYERVKSKLRNRSNIFVYYGDSGENIGKIIDKLIQKNNKSINFWLDGHFCHGVTGKSEKYDTPIVSELNTIKNFMKNHPSLKCVVAIDDFRCFGNDEAYPKKEFLVNWALELGMLWYVVSDIFFATENRHSC